MTLRLDWASHKAADYACRRFHYSGCLPTSKMVKVGVWEDGRYIGVIIYSRGASPHLGHAYDLGPTEICELTRIALTDHVAPVSQMIAISLRFLRQTAPGLRLVVSFADPFRGHHGGVYQAAGWIYTGQTGETIEYLVNGKWKHVKSMYVPKAYAVAAGRDAAWRRKHGLYYRLKDSGQLASIPTRTMPGKYRYLYPLDRQMRALVEPLALPYPDPLTVEA